MREKIITGNQPLMKSINKSLIIHIFMDNEHISRSQIADKVNLALPTIMRIVDELIEDKFLIEIGKGESNGGRKPILLKLNPEAIYFLGVNVARKLSIILTDLKGNEIAVWKEITNVIKGPEAIMAQIVKGVNLLIEENKIPYEKIGGVGIGTPGTNFKVGYLTDTFVFNGWVDLDIQKWVKNQLNFPVVVDNIAKSGAMGEMWFGKAKGINNFIYVFADYGIGSGIVINKDIYCGKNNTTGEIGHTIIQLDGEQCYCGNKGCLEMYASIPSILAQLLEALKKGEKSVLSDLIEKEKGQFNFHLVIRAMKEDDELTIRILKYAGEKLGTGIGNLINLFNPQIVVLGGEISANCPIYVESAKKVAYSQIFSKEAETTPIIVTGLNENAAGMGEVALAMNKKFRHPRL